MVVVVGVVSGFFTGVVGVVSVPAVAVVAPAVVVSVKSDSAVVVDPSIVASLLDLVVSISVSGVD